MRCAPRVVRADESTAGATWRETSGWLEGSSEGEACAWHGVSCNSEQRVVALSLPNNRLTGTLPVELSALTSVQYLCATRHALSSSCARSLEGGRAAVGEGG